MEKSKIGIHNSNKKYITNREKFKSTTKYHITTKINAKEKKVPENIVPTKNKNKTSYINVVPLRRIARNRYMKSQKRKKSKII